MSAVSTTSHLLHLQLPTDPRWANLASKAIDAILSDHAWCEQKAATTGISLIVRYAEKPGLVDALTPIVEEEWMHFRMVLSELKKRGLTLAPARNDEYVKQLMSRCKRGGSPADQLTDKLLISALIEARSCERFKLLHQQLEDPGLQQFYYDLMVSEAGHYVSFITLARQYQNRTLVDARWQEILKIESDIITHLAVREDRIH